MKKRNAGRPLARLIVCTAVISSLFLAGCTPLDVLKGITGQSQTESSDGTDIGQSVNKELYSEFDNIVFEFTSGAGGWFTNVSIGADGSFDGYYIDSDMGSTGPDHPYGSEYVSNFRGTLSEPERVNDYTYRASILSIRTEQEPGLERIEDGIKYIYTTPYGLDDTDTILIYTPDAPVKMLPQEFMSWMMGVPDADRSETLGSYALCNEKTGYGFSAIPADTIDSGEYDMPEASVPEASTQAGAADTSLTQPGPVSQYSPSVKGQYALDACEAAASRLYRRLETESLNQAELNQIAFEIYQIWDDQLNSSWGHLKQDLPADEMARLTEEEKQWIIYKENAAKEYASDAEGGSMYSMLYYDKAAEITRDRVYELIGEYL